MVTFVEENLTGQYKQLLVGKRTSSKYKMVNKFGSMIKPSEIEAAVN